MGAGNKEKIGVFLCVLVKYILHLGNAEFKEEEREHYTSLIEYISKIIRDVAEKYPDELLAEFRSQISSIQERIETRDPLEYPKRSDLLFYTVVGRTFSTSDMYHLVVTPTLILIGETLEYLSPDKYPTHLFSGVYLCALYLQYQRLSKRLMPEAINFMERAFLALIPEPEKLDNYKNLATRVRQPKRTKHSLKSTTSIPSDLKPLRISNWSSSTQPQLAHLLAELVSILDESSSLIFKDKSSFLEISKPFITIMKHLVIYHAATPSIPNLLSKLTNLARIAKHDRVPLTLQSHRAIAIPTYVPKFEENFNPDRKSYDPDRTRQEISKLRHQIKEERKQNMREIRKDAQFEAREQIKRKKKEYEEYHSKMAKIINSIQTEEGHDKNVYEREKRARKGKK
ncbi:unnamed protein product [Ambrosiozyma monospora]|uniref:Unnamed protein product n=1 Tax=Ambrosiozyma monospora TaxID=43982 RepID=A0ACB5TIZ5_AMBMO|nr:unnamed protein product [Ambrosiozyma monospora]